MPAANNAHKHSPLTRDTSTAASRACRRFATWIPSSVHSHTPTTCFAREEEVLFAVQALEPDVPDGVPAAVVAAPARSSRSDSGVATAGRDVLTLERGRPQNQVPARIADTDEVGLLLDDPQFKCTHMAVVVLARLAHMMIPLMVMPRIRVILTASHCHN